MADSVKKQIMAALLAKFTALQGTSGIRQVKRTRNVLAIEGAIQPAVLYAPGAEVKTGEDTAGRTFSFPLAITIACDIGVLDDIVSAVQTAMESDIQLGGLVNEMTGGEETPFLNSETGTDGGTVLVYEVVYRRRRGNPAGSY